MKKLSNIVKDKIFQCGSRNLVLKNMLYLLITQIVNYILPLITIKYLILTIGVTNFGKISFVQSFIFYFIVIIDYGFNISATRDIACCNKENKDAISKIFANTLTAKIILLTVCLFIYLYLVLLIPKFKEDKLIYILFSGVLIGTCLFPQWYFQGIQKMGYITLVNTLIKVLLLLSVFIFVKKGEDYVLVPFTYSLSYIISGLYALFLALKHSSFLGYCNKNAVVTAFKNGFPIFLSSAVSTILNGSSVFILGFIAEDNIVGYYSGFDKLIRSCLLIFAPITTAIYPHISGIIVNDYLAGVRYIRKAAKFTLLLALFIVILLIALSDYIIPLVFTDSFIQFKGVFVILSVWIIFSVANNFIGIQFYTCIGKSTMYTQSLVVCGVITLLLLIVLTKLQSCYGTAVSILFGEVLLTMILLLNIRLKRL
ncbi:oligosaccharide flippase family protein [Hoylesella pleuritidis]|uniref:Polysaccharide biosynthesis protein n=1 Tax=Hoylesella pleuritidis F0068 TaxID=1081904 RepID=U2MAS9_9BACT|nr:oligosaccharide flippase family protein [Hoylesella pleuritidis]ERJ98814.1 polysaccharide biosynthesis protein [Hoylesella pleuritidis F0068]